MAWKNLEQTTLVGAMMIGHAALKEFDDVHELIDWSPAKVSHCFLFSKSRRADGGIVVSFKV